MTYFKRIEFFTNGDVTDEQTLLKIDWWIVVLTPIREILGFAIKITDGVRFGDGTSQHYYRQGGAVDLRPVDRGDKLKMVFLGVALIIASRITRVCYYPPSPNFPTGGFHIDRKAQEKQLFVNVYSQEKPVDWKRVTTTEFLHSLMEGQ